MVYRVNAVEYVQFAWDTIHNFIDLFINSYLRLISRFGARSDFLSSLDNYHNSEEGPMTMAHHPLFLSSDIIGVKDLPRELPGGGHEGVYMCPILDAGNLPQTSGQNRHQHAIFVCALWYEEAHDKGEYPPTVSTTIMPMRSRIPTGGDVGEETRSRPGGHTGRHPDSGGADRGNSGGPQR